MRFVFAVEAVKGRARVVPVWSRKYKVHPIDGRHCRRQRFLGLLIRLLVLVCLAVVLVALASGAVMRLRTVF